MIGTRLTFALRVDATAASGAGHAIRQLALAEELSHRGHRVVFLGDITVGWVREQLQRMGYPVVAPRDDAPVTQAAELGAHVVMIDGYQIPASVGTALRAAGVPVAAMVDGEFGAAQRADLYVDQNCGAAEPVGVPAGARTLIGLSHVLIRDEFRQRRPVAPVSGSDQPPRVLVVFGGTDPFRGCPLLAGLLVATGLPVTILAIAAGPDSAVELGRIQVGKGQRLEVLPPIDDLAAIAVECDVVISAAGSTVWEMLVLGRPLGVVCVVDNQLPGYQATIATGLVVALGELAQLRTDARARTCAIEQLTELLTDPELRRLLSAAGLAAVDGLGRVRVAAALEELARR